MRRLAMFPGSHDHLQLSRTEIVITTLLKSRGEFEFLQLLLQVGPLKFLDASLELLIEQL